MEKPKIYDMKDIGSAWIKQKSTKQTVDCLILNESKYELVKKQLDKPFREDGILKVKLSKDTTVLINADTKIIVGR